MSGWETESPTAAASSASALAPPANFLLSGKLSLKRRTAAGRFHGTGHLCFLLIRSFLWTVVETPKHRVVFSSLVSQDL